VLAVKADYQNGQATIGTKAGAAVLREEILASLKSIGYSGTFVEE
jgi:cyanophycinase-like exopeptidase